MKLFTAHKAKIIELRALLSEYKDLLELVERVHNEFKPSFDIIEADQEDIERHRRRLETINKTFREMLK